MELRVLGAVEVHAGGRVIEPERPQQRLVLAALAVEAGRLVPVDALVDRVWGDAPPERAHRMLHTHITRIRGMLRQAAADTRDGARAARLVRRTNGYVLEVTPELVDLHRFRQIVEQASTPDRAAADRIALLRAALALWRGEPLAGLSGPWVEQTRRALLQQRLPALVAWSRAELDAGNPSAVINPLADAVAEYPLVEPLAAALIRALATAGRGAEALTYYAIVRRQLADELGADPGPELQKLHAAVLRGRVHAAAQDGGVRPSAEVATPVVQWPKPPPPPAQLPADVSAFTGRGAELARLDHLLTVAESPATGTGAPALVIAAVAGPAGVGKTALAVRWAHRVRGSFPDGQLYVDLRGYDPKQPVSTEDALARFLRSLGVGGPDLPVGLDEQAAHYRTLLDGRRMLVILDNASSVEQVRPLLPGSPSCFVLVTSRDSLAGLVARQGAQRVGLDPLPLDDAVALLTRLVGARTAAEPEAATALATRCARLPLALRVAAELAATRWDTRLSDLAEELADHHRRLEVLDAAGDPRTGVRAVLSWSYRHLPADAARAFQLVGLHPCSNMDGYAVAALAGTSLTTARRLLDLFARAHLIDPTTTAGRYGMHDLLRAYAAGLAETHLSAADRREAQGRLFDYYLAAAAAAMDALYPAETLRRPRVPSPATGVPPLADPDTAQRWLDLEHQTLITLAVHTATDGWPTHAVRFSTTLSPYLDGSHHADALLVHGHARQAAQEAGDRAGQAEVLNSLGAACLRLGRHPAAAEHLRQALTLCRQAGDPVGAGWALNGLGEAAHATGDTAGAIPHHTAALTIASYIGARDQQARAHAGLGHAHHALADPAQARRHYQQALTLYADLGSPRAGDIEARMAEIPRPLCA